MKAGNIVNEYRSKRNMINDKESDDASVRDSRTVDEEDEEESKMDDKEESSGGDEIESEKEASRYCILSVIVSLLHASLCYSLLCHV